MRTAVMFERARVVAILSTLLAAAPFAGPAVAEEPATEMAPAPAPAPVAVRGSVGLEVGTGKLIQLPKPAKAVFIANPDVADAHTPSPNRIFLFGKSAGNTTVYALDDEGNTIIQRTVTVRRNLDDLSAALRQRFPQYSLSLSSAPGSLMVSGQVDTSKDASEVMATVEQFLGEKEKPVNRLTIATPTQVSLHVKLVEVSRQANQSYGINWSAVLQPGNWNFVWGGGRSIFSAAGSQLSNGPNLAGGNLWTFGGGYVNGNKNLEALVDAMEQEQLLTTLAEPNLMAISGQTASFLAGGEFPIPTSQINGAISVEFKQFGIGLNFTPTVLSRNHISLHVRPEVSQIDPSTSVAVGNGLSVPGLTVRRVDTTVELGSGETLAIGGLLQNNLRDVVNKFPGLGNVPVLGRLFSSPSYQNNESELVVLVTPYIVKPMDNPSAAMTPTDALRPATDAEFVVKRDFALESTDPATPRLHGPAGFVY